MFLLSLCSSVMISSFSSATPISSPPPQPTNFHIQDICVPVMINKLNGVVTCMNGAVCSPASSTTNPTCTKILGDNSAAANMPALPHTDNFPISVPCTATSFNRMNGATNCAGIDGLLAICNEAQPTMCTIKTTAPPPPSCTITATKCVPVMVNKMNGVTTCKNGLVVNPPTSGSATILSTNELAESMPALPHTASFPVGGRCVQQSVNALNGVITCLVTGAVVSAPDGKGNCHVL